MTYRKVITTLLHNLRAAAGDLRCEPQNISAVKLMEMPTVAPFVIIQAEPDRGVMSENGVLSLRTLVVEVHCGVQNTADIIDDQIRAVEMAEVAETVMNTCFRNCRVSAAKLDGRYPEYTSAYVIMHVPYKRATDG